MQIHRLTVRAMEVNTSLFIFTELLNTVLDLPAVWLTLSVCAYTNKKRYFFPIAFEKQLFSLNYITMFLINFYQLWGINHRVDNL